MDKENELTKKIIKALLDIIVKEKYDFSLLDDSKFQQFDFYNKSDIFNYILRKPADSNEDLKKIVKSFLSSIEDCLNIRDLDSIHKSIYKFIELQLFVLELDAKSTYHNPLPLTCLYSAATNIINKSFKIKRFEEKHIEQYLRSDLSFDNLLNKSYDPALFLMNPLYEIPTLLDNILQYICLFYEPFDDLYLEWHSVLSTTIRNLYITDRDIKKAYNSLNFSPKYLAFDFLKFRNYCTVRINELINQEVLETKNLTVKNMYCDLPLMFKTKHDRYPINNINEFIDIWHKDAIKKLTLNAPPGYGKSFFLKYLAFVLMKKGYNVLFFELNDASLSFNTSISNIASTASQLDNFIKASLDESMFQFLTHERTVFIFDGLDELRIDELKHIYDTLITLVNYSSNNYTIISGREYLFDILKRNFSMDIELSELYLKKCSSRAGSLLLKYNTLLHTHISMQTIEEIDKEFLEVPLLIFLIVWTCGNGNGFMYIKNEAELYDTMLKVVWERTYKAHLNRINSIIQNENNDYAYNYVNYKHSLQIIGYVGYTNKSTNIAIGSCYHYAEFKHNKNFSQWMSTEKNKSSRLIMEFFLESSKIGFVTFFHRTFYEYLAQCEIIDNILNYRDIRDFDFFVSMAYIKQDISSKIFYRAIYQSLLQSEKDVFKKNLSKILTEFYIYGYRKIKYESPFNWIEKENLDLYSIKGINSVINSNINYLNGRSKTTTSNVKYSVNEMNNIEIQFQDILFNSFLSILSIVGPIDIDMKKSSNTFFSLEREIQLKDMNFKNFFANIYSKKINMSNVNIKHFNLLFMLNIGFVNFCLDNVFFEQGSCIMNSHELLMDFCKFTNITLMNLYATKAIINASFIDVYWEFMFIDLLNEGNVLLKNCHFKTIYIHSFKGNITFNNCFFWDDCSGNYLQCETEIVLTGKGESLSIPYIISLYKNQKRYHL